MSNRWRNCSNFLNSTHNGREDADSRRVVAPVFSKPLGRKIEGRTLAVVGKHTNNRYGSYYGNGCMCYNNLPASFLNTLSAEYTHNTSAHIASKKLNISAAVLVNWYHIHVMHNVITVLYKEQIPPVFEEIRRRLDKHSCCQVLQETFPNICKNGVVFNNTHTLCVLLKKLPFSSKPFIVEEKHSEISIYLTDKPEGFTEFIDPNDSKFPYPPEFLCVVFFHLVDRYRCDPKGAAYKGGRFLLAELLRNDGPLELRTFSIGKLCHLLQKSLDMGILSYENNSIRSAASCDALSRAYAARGGEFESAHIKKELLTTIRMRLRQYLKEYPQGLPMCRLPIMYKQDYETSINIGTLGYTKLAEFLSKEASDICKIKPSAKHRVLILPINQNTSNDGRQVLTKDNSQEQYYELGSGKRIDKQKQWTQLICGIRTHRWVRGITINHWCPSDKDEAPYPSMSSYNIEEENRNLSKLKSLWLENDAVSNAASGYFARSERQSNEEPLITPSEHLYGYMSTEDDNAGNTYLPIVNFNNYTSSIENYISNVKTANSVYIEDTVKVCRRLRPRKSPAASIAVTQNVPKVPQFRMPLSVSCIPCEADNFRQYYNSKNEEEERNDDYDSNTIMSSFNFVIDEDVKFAYNREKLPDFAATLYTRQRGMSIDQCSETSFYSASSKEVEGAPSVNFNSATPMSDLNDSITSSPSTTATPSLCSHEDILCCLQKKAKELGEVKGDVTSILTEIILAATQALESSNAGNEV